MYSNKIIHGDCLKVMKTLEDNHIDLTVTSPPYDNLRDYNGYSFDFEGIAKELYRITKDGGVVVWVIGDATINGSETGTSFRQALYFMGCGFNLHDTMIYQTNKPPLTHNRYEQNFEFMFILSKGKPKAFNPIKIRCAYIGSKMDRPETKKGSRSQNSAIRSRRNDFKIKKLKIKYNIWEYKSGGSHTTKDKFAFEHPAIFPEQLAYDHIISWSNEGDLVFDPFLGSGTTAKMAERAKRRWVGIEISKEYCEIAQKRINLEKEQIKLSI